MLCLFQDCEERVTGRNNTVLAEPVGQDLQILEAKTHGIESRDTANLTVSPVEDRAILSVFEVPEVSHSQIIRENAYLRFPPL